MEFGNIVEFLENKTIFISGATGFLAKIFIEKILRIQPNVKKLYLLMRAKDAHSAMLRLHQEVISKDLFKVLREKYGKSLQSFIMEKVIVIAGDISSENLGIEDHNLRNQMWSEIHVVVNFAATTNFNERYDVALGINTFGALNVLNFSKKCHQLMMLVHVSTAYVCGEDKGVILEKPFSMGESKRGDTKLDVNQERKLVSEKLLQLLSADMSPKEITTAMKDFGLQRAKEYGWPNTYVFTKAMGEMILMHHKEDLPLIITRPAMVTSTYNEPIPGWIEGIRTIDSIIVGYGQGKLTCFICNPNTTIDLIPADMVINGIIVAMVAGVTQKSPEIIYHLGSSSTNPINFSMMCAYCFRYFSTNPWNDKHGNPIKVVQGRALRSFNIFYWFMIICYVLPIKVLKLAGRIMFHNKYQEWLTVLERQINIVMKLAKFYKPYAFFEGIFDDSNSENLRRAMKERSCNEAEKFKFDPTEIDWDNYIMTTHIPGLAAYSVK